MITIYLDVDGVLNAFGIFSEAKKGSGWPNFDIVDVVADGRPWPITYAPELVGYLNSLATDERVRFKWLTTWVEWAPANLAPAIGLKGEDWPVVGQSDHDRRNNDLWWKWIAIRNDVNETDHVVWIDDDLSFENGAVDWLATRGNSTAITPDSYVGLTRDHIADLEALVQQHE